MGIFYRNNGAITVFLSLILVPILILAGIAVDAVKIYGARAIMSDSAELTINTGLASYNQVLKDAFPESLGFFMPSFTKVSSATWILFVKLLR